MRLKPQLALIPQSENLPGLEVTIEPWKKLMVHEVIEYPFDDLVRLVLLQARAAGGGIPSMN